LSRSVTDPTETDRLTGFLAALQLADSFFPTGAYAHSHGLEGMVRRGLVRTAAEVHELLANQLACSIGPSDGVALLNVHRVGSRSAAVACLADVVTIDWRLNALKLPRELRQASCQIGRRLLAETGEFSLGDLRASYAAKVAQGAAPGHNAVALGLTAVDLGIPEELVFGVLCPGYVVGILGAAMRLLPVSHHQCQRILRDVQPVVQALYIELAERSASELTAFAPELDLAAIGHAADEVRMFAS
jgi:urease accessory protein